MRAVFFTDVDGTLLDHDTYSYEKSIEGIELLNEHSIPLIPVSSKTFSELVLIMERLGINNVFGFENGSGIAYPSGDNRNYRHEITGPGVVRLQELFPELERISGKKLKSILSLTTDEITGITGLDTAAAAMARERMSTLPFIVQGENLLSQHDIREINIKLVSYELAVTKGTRFNHLIPLNSGKDYALKKIIEFYRDKFNDEIVTASAGDSMNDLVMLVYSDYAYIIRNKDGSFIESEKAKLINKTGPEGFTMAVKDFVKIITG